MKMNKEILRTHTVDVHNLLTEYIRIHDSLFKKQATLFSLIRNIFKPINFQESYVETEILLSRFISKKQELESLSNIHDDPKYGKYYDCLMDYYDTLIEAVKTLNQRQGILAGKSKGEKLSLPEYQAIEKEYKNAVKKYIDVGGQLNKMTYLVVK